MQTRDADEDLEAWDGAGLARALQVIDEHVAWLRTVNAIAAGPRRANLGLLEVESGRMPPVEATSMTLRLMAAAEPVALRLAPELKPPPSVVGVEPPISVFTLRLRTAQLLLPPLADAVTLVMQSRPAERACPCS